MNPEDILFTLCKPYLLDLLRLLIDSLEHPNEPFHELAEGKKYKFSNDTIGRFNELTSEQIDLLIKQICELLIAQKISRS